MTVPLCVDCDGTLLRTDLLHEAILRLLKRRPWMIFVMIGWLLGGKADFKARVAARAPVDPRHLPLRDEVMALIAGARAEGRPVILATAADRSHAQAVADHLGLFDDVLSTEGQNLASHAKARALVDRYGEKGFDYVGDSKADVAIWAVARKAYVVAATRDLARRLKRGGIAAEALGPAPKVLRPLAKALRPHQWLKNLLVLLPPLAGHQLNAYTLTRAGLAFLAFSLCASSVYLLNDLLDVDADRVHARKYKRPFAAGTLKVMTGAKLSPLLFLASLGVAALAGPLFLFTLLVYAAMTTLYSFKLKQHVIVDVILLAMLYTIRIIGGSAATHISPSFWLLAFAMFLFFSLALVKRHSEVAPLLAKDEGGQIAGRGYVAADLPVLMALGVASGMNAVLVLALYLDSDAVRAIYPSNRPILIAPALVLYWIGRLWMKTQRGEVHDDPVVFAAKDWQTLVILAVLAALFLLASAGLFAHHFP